MESLPTMDRRELGVAGVVTATLCRPAEATLCRPAYMPESALRALWDAECTAVEVMGCWVDWSSDSLVDAPAAVVAAVAAVAAVALTLRMGLDCCGIMEARG
jgi:hypothetical protein